MNLFARLSHCLLLSSLILAVESRPSIADQSVDVKPLAGEYVVSGIRRSGTVESVADAEPNISDRFGASVSFGDQFVWMDGTSCESWSVRESSEIRMNLYDDNLSDLAIAPLESPDLDVVANVVSYDILCDELVMIANVIRIDDRLLTTVSPSGSYNLLLEKPLTTAQVEKLQAQLANMKYYEGEITGVMDMDTRAAAAAYADYRGADYIFRDVAITRNLLDGLGVLEEEN